jgi:hypothetical protein
MGKTRKLYRCVECGSEICITGVQGIQEDIVRNKRFNFKWSKRDAELSKVKLHRTISPYNKDRLDRYLEKYCRENVCTFSYDTKYWPSLDSMILIKPLMENGVQSIFKPVESFVRMFFKDADSVLSGMFTESDVSVALRKIKETKAL